MREWMVTPSVVVDETRLQRNVQRMQQLANDHHVQLRPHVKTHKTVEITAMQLQAGACGITVAKPSEAHKFLHSGLKSLKSILVAYPVVQTAKIGKLLVAAQQFGMEVRMTIDSAAGIDAVEKAANSCDYQVKVLIHIDVGYHRVGLEEGDPKILEFTKRIEKSPNLEFTGLLSHAGHAYSCKTVEECAKIAETERSTLVRIKSSLEESGIAVPVVSVGSTLTEPARKSFVGITEIRPGNYVFLDRTPVNIGLFSIQDVSLGILVTVVSSNKYYFIVDAGSKVLSSDAPRAVEGGTFGTNCYGLAFYEKDFERLDKPPTQNKSVMADGHEITCFEVSKLSEEHGWIKQVEGIAPPPIGQRMIIFPNHACVVANLTDNLYIQGAQSKSWKVFARGCSQ
uniref:D-serine dehydratase n=1 Tax=Globisporangium ultimum (strain ATCC 200006 / CBS 805.95 / DAOM BR144) TaxID=431595 RepID=K3X9Z9_GLOUD